MAKTDLLHPHVVCDAGPLIHLDELGCLNLLADFKSIIVPAAVWAEVEQHRPSVFRNTIPFKKAAAPSNYNDTEITEIDVISMLYMLHPGG